VKRLSSLLLALVALGCLWQAGRLHGPLLEMRATHRLNAGKPLENTPPLVAFTTIALGGFRGLIADVLWLRATQLQQDGKFFELVQLADWITKLEPRFALVWAFHGWNMAYNVSVMLDDPKDRWRWVRHGIVLLRDEGLTYNPGSADLHRELGWLFQHKLGGFLDQAHLYYKRAWAEEMMKLFDGPRPDYEKYMAVPRTEKELLKRAGMAEFVQKLRAAGGDPFSQALLDPEHLAPPLRELLQGDKHADELILYLRVRRLVQEYKLLPELMREVDAKYGPLDWRLPQAHAIYWAHRGQEFATGFAQVSLDRMIFQSMADAFWQGSLFYDAQEDLFQPSPNLELLGRVRQAYEQAIAAHPDESSIRSAHRNFLIAAIAITYTYHRIADTRALFEELSTRYPSEDTKAGFEQFLHRTYAGRVKDLSQREAQALVEATLAQSYFWLALGDEERGAGYEQFATLYWREYMKTRQDPEMRERTGLPPLDRLRQQARDRVLESLKTKQARARLEAGAEATR
jgi:hypothetical protein